MTMKNITLKFFGLVFSIILLTSCNNGSGDKTTDFKQLVQDWNKAHSSKDVGVFSNLFDNSVLFYGTQQDKNACIENKLSLFKKYPDFFQQIYGDIQIENLSDTEVKCSFVKRVTVNQATTDYPSYLTFKKVGDNWKVAIEGDLVTDKNIAKKDEPANNKVSSTSDFISGLTTSKVYTKEQAEKGSEFNYSDGRKFKIKFFFEQLDVLFYAYNENDQKQRVMTNFEAGYSSPDGEMLDLKDKAKFLVGQYDFNADNIDELVIAIQDNDDMDNGLSINVFELTGDTWKQIGVMTGKTILGEPRAEVKMNKITIPRNLRGFYYQWTFESGKFKNTSDI